MKLSPTQEKEMLSGAFARFTEAAAGLAEDGYASRGDRGLAATLSRYDALRISAGGSPRRGSDGRSASAGRPPCWLEATALRDSIDRGCRRWLGAKGGDAPAVLFVLMRSNRWGPADVTEIATMTETIKQWCRDIDALLDPPSVKTISTPCPSCGAASVSRRDEFGSTVRKPALQLTAAGCSCLSCRAIWSPDHFVLLAKILEFPLPAGVLE